MMRERKREAGLLRLWLISRFASFNYRTYDFHCAAVLLKCTILYRQTDSSCFIPIVKMSSELADPNESIFLGISMGHIFHS